MPKPTNPRPKVNPTPDHAEMLESAKIEAALNETGAMTGDGLRRAGETAAANLADKQTGGPDDGRPGRVIAATGDVVKDSGRGVTSQTARKADSKSK